MPAVRALRLPNADALLRDRAQLSVIAAFVLAWTGMAVGVVREHHLFRTERFDLGNMVQAVWSTAHGRPFEATDAYGEQVVRLASHVEPILVVFAPLWWLWPSAELLLVIQAGAIAAGAIPLFWIARKHGGDALAVTLCLVYLLSPTLSGIALDDFHPEALAIPLLLLAAWFADEDRLWLFMATATFAVLTKETIGLTVAALAVWYAARSRRLAPAVVAVGALGWTVFCLRVVVPHFSGGSSVHYRQYESLGGGPVDIVRTALTDPLRVLQAGTSLRDVAYVTLLVVLFLGALPLFSRLVFVALPSIALNILADAPTPTDVLRHYSAAVVPILFAAAALALGRLGHWARPATYFALLASSLLVAAPYLERLSANGRPDAHRVELIERALAFVPGDAAVSATNQIGAHVSDRVIIESFPLVRNATWVVADEHDGYVPTTTTERTGGALLLAVDDPQFVARRLRRLRVSSAWQTVYACEGVVVLRRAATRAKPRSARDVACATALAP